MVGSGGSLSIQTDVHDQGYIIIPCDIGPIYSFDLVLHTTRPLSYLSPDAADLVGLFGDIAWVGGDVHRVRNLRIEGRLFPEIFVRISSGPALLGFDGFLGLHFLKQFSEVCFDRSTGLLTVAY